MTREELMRKAIELSIDNVAAGGGPFGAVIAKDGEIIATGVNRVTADHDPTAHAEVSAIRQAARKLGTFDLSLNRKIAAWNRIGCFPGRRSKLLKTGSRRLTRPNIKV